MDVTGEAAHFELWAGIFEIACESISAAEVEMGT